MGLDQYDWCPYKKWGQIKTQTIQTEENPQNTKGESGQLQAERQASEGNLQTP